MPGRLRPRRLGGALGGGPAATASRAYGTETMHVLRAEKGYIIVGQDTDGTVTPDDAGLGWAIGKAKPDFVGKRSLDAARHAGAGPQAARRPADRRPEGRAGGGRADRRRPEPADADDDARPRHLVLLERRARPLDRAGAWSSAAATATGETLHVPMPDRTLTAKVVKSTVFYDPENTRLSA